MILAFLALDNVKDVNTFDEVTQITFLRGNPGTLYFRLTQQVQESDTPDAVQRRYVPALGSTIVMFFEHIDVSKCFNRVAFQPFPNDDRSIWAINIMPTDIWQPNSMVIQFTEGSNQPIRCLPASDINQESTHTRRFYL